MTLERIIVFSFTFTFLIILIMQGPLYLLHYHSLSTDNAYIYKDRRRKHKGVYQIYAEVQGSLVMTSAEWGVVYGDLLFDIPKMAE